MHTSSLAPTVFRHKGHLLPTFSADKVNKNLLKLPSYTKNMKDIGSVAYSDKLCRGCD